MGHRSFAATAAVSSDDSVSDDDTIAAAIDAYRDTWAQVDDIIAAASFDALCARPGELGDANLRWVVMHLLEETARHAGHADIIRESIDGAKALPLMAAVEQWPPRRTITPWRPPEA